MGNRLLTALGGLFVSNTNEDIRIEFTALEPGFQVKDSKAKDENIFGICACNRKVYNINKDDNNQYLCALSYV